MAITKTQICNLALSHLGHGKELSNVDTDANAESSACLMYYEHVVKNMLREWRWPFATKVAVLFHQEDNPTQEWAYSYMYPADCLKIRKIQSETRLDTRDTRIAYRAINAIATSDPDGIALSQTPSGAGNLTLAGTFASGNAYTATEGRQVTITSDANDSARTFTVTGTDRDDAALVEAVTGPNATTVTSTGYFKTITTIAVDAATAGAITVGVSASAGKEILTDCAPETDSTGASVGPYLEYTKNFTDSEVSKFDYDFSMATSLRLAAMIAPRITGGDSFNLSGRSFELYNQSIAIARQNAAAEEQPDIEPESELIRARA